jgi:hypothetical protein
MNAKDLTVSVIARGRPSMLECTLRNLVETSPAGVTLQVLENPPRDDVHEVIVNVQGEWPGRVKLLRTNRSMNFVDAHNFALQHVDTTLVNFMGDDDLNLPGRLQKQLQVLTTEQDVLACGTFAYRVGGRLGRAPRIGGRMAIGPTSRDACRSILLSGELIYMVFPSVIARSAALRAVGGFRPEFGIAADVDLWTRLAACGPVLAIPEYLFGFRIHDGSGSTSLYWEGEERTRFARACAQARAEGAPEPLFDHWRKAWNAQRRDVKWRVRRAARSRYHFRRAGAAFLEARYGTAAQQLMTSVWLSPHAAVSKLLQQLGRRN